MIGEHFFYSLIQNSSNDLIDKVFITASGGPFLNFQIRLKKLKKHLIIKLENGKKNLNNSSTMMNKVFKWLRLEIINLKYKDIIILTHPKSYVHAIVKFQMHSLNY